MRSFQEVVNSAVKEYQMGFFTKSQAEECISWRIREGRQWIVDVKEVRINKKSVRILSSQVDVKGNPLPGLVLNTVKL